MQIGEVAEQVGLSLRTVRYYEEVGLVSPVQRSAGGFRIYDEHAVDRLRLIRDLKPLGFSLDEIRTIVDAVTSARGGTADVHQIRQYVDRAREQHERALHSLQAAERIIEALEQLTAGSEGQTPET